MKDADLNPHGPHKSACSCERRLTLIWCLPEVYNVMKMTSRGINQDLGVRTKGIKLILDPSPLNLFSL